MAAVPLTKIAPRALISPFECSLLVLITFAPVNKNNSHTDRFFGETLVFPEHGPEEFSNYATLRLFIEYQ